MEQTRSWERALTPETLAKAQEKNPFKKLNDIVYEIIEDAIVSYGVEGGTKLNTVQIAKLLGISRTPVSEALEQLRVNGLVVTYPDKKGFYVFDVSHTSLEQLFIARRALEGTAAYLCARQNTLVDLKMLEKLAKLFSATFEKRYFVNFSRIDQTFHNTIVNSCGNPYIVKMYKAIQKSISYYSVRSQDFMLSLGDDPSFGVLATQHVAIYRAIELGMPDLAEAASKTHLDTCYTLSLRYHTFAGNI